RARVPRGAALERRRDRAVRQRELQRDRPPPPLLPGDRRPRRRHRHGPRTAVGATLASRKARYQHLWERALRAIAAKGRSHKVAGIATRASLLQFVALGGEGLMLGGPVG